MDQELIKQCTEEAQKWLSPAFDADTQAEVRAMLDNEDKTALIDSTRTLNSELVVCEALWVPAQTV